MRRADDELDVRLSHIDPIDWRGDCANLERLHDELATRPSFVDTAPPKARAFRLRRSP